MSGMIEEGYAFMMAIRKLFLCIFIGLVVSCSGAEPSNRNPFTWKATLEDGTTLTGDGTTYLLKKAFRKIQAEINAQAKAGKLSNGQRMRIEVTWKGAVFKRTLIAKSQ